MTDETFYKVSSRIGLGFAYVLMIEFCVGMGFPFGREFVRHVGLINSIGTLAAVIMGCELWKLIRRQFRVWKSVDRVKQQ